eukprot:GILI01006210.1.p1 GENE.GILI01006210.1~~GILI01006210.1.p1  ORF type:complete len:352 (-),score=126.67 GILI01006210.1:343-1398(-)
MAHIDHDAGHDSEFDLPVDARPRILLMGLRRSGKTSIQKVVFHKMSPHETLFLESTNKIDIKGINNNAFVQFTVLDFPGTWDWSDPLYTDEAIFKSCGALVFVIDAQDEPYNEALQKLYEIVTRAHKVNPKIFFEVFIHKVDGDLFLSDEAKIDCQRDIHSQVTEELYDAKLNIHMSFYLTSIYDHSIFEAFSKVVHKLLPQHPTLENLLDILIANSRIEKAFLFDVVSKIYIATDSSPVDMQSYELCSDMIDVVIDVSCIYGMKEGDTDNLAYDSQSQSLMKLNSSMVLYLKEVERFLALVCLVREEHFDRQHLIDYNIECFKQALRDVLLERKRHLQALEDAGLPALGN